MDIVVPSNFERFLFVLVNHDSKRLKALMTKIKSEGILDLGEGKEQAMEVVHSIFLAGRASDAEIESKAAVKSII
jgi:threonine synthase